MTLRSFTSHLLISVVALALTSVCAVPAFASDHFVSKGFTVITVLPLDNTITTELHLLTGTDGKQFLYLASTDGHLSIFDVTRPSHLRELNSWRLTSSDTQNLRIEPINDRFVIASDAKTDTHVAVLDVSDAASKEISRQFKHVDAYAVDDNKQVLYVAQPGKLTVVRFDHPIDKDAEHFEESYEAR